MTSVTACIVTYNRKQDLMRCVSAVLSQSWSVNALLIVDNASTDGTFEQLVQLLDPGCLTNYPLCDTVTQIGSTNVFFVRMNENTGGAGGFYAALKYSERFLNSDYYWLMDDDGYPSPNCLNYLVNESINNNRDYVMPVSIDIDNHEKLSWPSPLPNGIKTDSYQALSSAWGGGMEHVTPFNGVLLSQHCVSSVGYVKKELFIWGDEYEHYWRCVRHGVKPITITDAIFYHPANKLPFVKVFFGLFSVPFVDSPLRMVCLARNYAFIHKENRQYKKLVMKFIAYSWLFLIVRRWDFGGYKLYIASFVDGLLSKFDRHKKFLK